MFRVLERLVSLTRPQVVLYLAIDGVGAFTPPRRPAVRDPRHWAVSVPRTWHAPAEAALTRSAAGPPQRHAPR